MGSTILVVHGVVNRSARSMEESLAKQDDPAPGASDAERKAIADWDEAALATSIARRYYLDDQSKVHIAKELGLSRFQVARLLTEARQRGIVRIEITSPGRVDRELSAALQTELGLPRAVVIEAQRDSHASSLRHIGSTLGDVLGDLIHEGDVVGVAWSRAIEYMAGQLRKLQPCTVVQLGGALHLPPEHQGSVELVRRIATVAGGTAHPVYAPFVVDDAGTAAGLRKQPQIAAALEMVEQLDLTVTSVGAWRPSASTIYDEVEDDLRRAARDQGACGEVCGRLFDAEGNTVVTSLEERVVGITGEQLRGVPQRIVTSYGSYRAEATVGAVRAGYVSTLVTDDELARAVLG